MRFKIILCAIVLLVSCGSLTSHAHDNSTLDQKTMDRLRETYELDIPETPSSLDTWKHGDIGISLEPSFIADFLQGMLCPVWFLARQILHHLPA